MHHRSTCSRNGRTAAKDETRRKGGNVSGLCDFSVAAACPGWCPWPWAGFCILGGGGCFRAGLGFRCLLPSLMQRAGQVSARLPAPTSGFQGGGEAASSFLCSLSGEVGQKEPEVRDAWLQNLCARLGPRVTDWSVSAAWLGMWKRPGKIFMVAKRRGAPSPPGFGPSRGFTADEQIDCQLRCFTQTLRFLVFHRCIIGFLWLNIQNLSTSLGLCGEAGRCVFIPFRVFKLERKRR